MRHPGLSPSVEDYLVQGVTTAGWPTLRAADLERLLDNLPEIARNLGLSSGSVQRAVSRAMRNHRPDLVERWRRECRSRRTAAE